MCRNLYIVLLLCVAMLAPSIASAQESIWSRQKIAIASIIDKTERGLDENFKRGIYNNIRDALVSNYDTFEVNINDVKNSLKANNLPPSPQNVNKKIGERGADFIIFTEIRATSSSYDALNTNTQIIIVLSQHRIATGKEVSRTKIVSPTPDAVRGGISQLISELFGVNFSGSNISQNQYNNSQSSSSSRNAYNNSSSYSSQSSYGQSSSYQQSTYKTYKVGDYYDVGGKQGVVFAVTYGGRHGMIVSLWDLGYMNWDAAEAKCHSRGASWRLPTKDELLAIYDIKSVINSTLSAVGDRIDTVWYWSSTIYNSSCAWLVNVGDGNTYNYHKNGDFYVRAVSAF